MSGSSADVVERALALSRADGCVVLVEESSSANLRWANNTLTTNGAVRGRSVTVISVVGESVGVRSATVVDAARGPGARSASRRRATPRRPRTTGRSSRDRPPPTSPSPRRETPAGVFADVARDLGERLRARLAPTASQLFGYASHDLTTTWLGSSTGLRLRHAQPTGYVELTGKSSGGSSLGRPAHARLDATCACRRSTPSCAAGSAGARGSSTSPPAATRRCCRRRAVADLMAYAYWTAAGRSAAEGRTVFSRPGGGTRVGEHLGPAGLRLSSRPARPRARDHAVRRRDRVVVDDERLRQRAAADRHRLDPRRRARGARADARVGAATGAAVTPYVAQPRRGRRRHGQHRRDGRLHRARAAADLPLVHPRGRPGDAAAHRAHPRRRLPRRGRRGRRGGQQLPLEREPGRPARPAQRGRPQRARRCRASGATTSPGRACRRCACRTST